MKKRKLNLPKLSLNKEVISSLSQGKITGGAGTQLQTCFGTCHGTLIDCPGPTVRGTSCVIPCEPIVTIPCL